MKGALVGPRGAARLTLAALGACGRAFGRFPAPRSPPSAQCGSRGSTPECQGRGSLASLSHFPWAVLVPSCLPHPRIACGTLLGGILCRPSPRSLSARCSPSPPSWSRSRPPPRRRPSMASIITVISLTPLHPQSCLDYVLAMPVRQRSASLHARLMRRESQSGQQLHPCCISGERIDVVELVCDYLMCIRRS